MERNYSKFLYNRIKVNLSGGATPDEGPLSKVRSEKAEVCNCDTMSNYRKQKCTSKKSGNAIPCTHRNSDGEHRCIESGQTRQLSEKCVSTCAKKFAWRNAPCAPAGGTTTKGDTAPAAAAEKKATQEKVAAAEAAKKLEQEKAAGGGQEA